jgi:hypothetical protein
MTLHRQAAKIATKGRNGDSMLVHMTPEEVGGLHALALSAYGKPLTINPETGVVEASLLKKLLPTIAGAVVGSVIPGAGTWGSAIAGGITSGFANGWKPRSIIGGMLGGGAGRELVNRFAVAGTPATPTAPAQGGGSAPIMDEFGDALPKSERNMSPAPATTPAGIAQKTADIAAKGNATPVKPTFKNVGEGIRSILMDEKAREQFTKDNFWPIAAALGSYSMIPEKYNGPKGTPTRFWKQKLHRGTKVNPLWQQQQGQPYYTDQYWEDGEYTTEDPFAKGYASGGDVVRTEEPVKTAPNIVNAPVAAPAQRYYSTDYKSSYHDPLMDYIDAVNARRKPVSKTGAGTGIETDTRPGGGSNPTTTIGGDVGSYTGTGTGSSIGVVGPPGATVPVSYGPGSTPVNPLPAGITSGGANIIGGAVNAALPFGGWSGNSGTTLTGPLSNALNSAATGTAQGPLVNQINATLPTFPVNINPSSSLTSTASSWLNSVTNNPVADTFKTIFELPTTAIDSVADQMGKTLSLSDKNLELLKTALNLGVQGPTWAASHIQRVLAQFKKAKEDEKAQQDKPPATPASSGAQVTTGNGSPGGIVGSDAGLTMGNQTGIPGGSVIVEDVPGAYGAPGKAAGGMLGYGYAGGGGIASLGGYSDGGRLLRGPGDGVSDDIPARIHRDDGTKQEARLADGEFVFPARIVSEIGNGSTEAGAKKLYDIMNRIQRDRGRSLKDVAFDSNAERHFNGLMA